MCGNYSREETIQGWRLYEEIRNLSRTYETDNYEIEFVEHGGYIIITIESYK